MKMPVPFLKVLTWKNKNQAIPTKIRHWYNVHVQVSSLIYWDIPALAMK